MDDIFGSWDSFGTGAGVGVGTPSSQHQYYSPSSPAQQPQGTPTSPTSLYGSLSSPTLTSSGPSTSSRHRGGGKYCCAISTSFSSGRHSSWVF
jgi:hypothetical protein